MDSEDKTLPKGFHREDSRPTWVLDLVCGMDVDSTTTPFYTTYKEETFYFCNQNCMTHFVDNPTRYTGLDEPK
jgi:YHS domain-containing protein